MPVKKSREDRILVVDDDAEILDTISSCLENRGFLVTRAKTGGECLREIKNEMPDLVILDVDMPGINGLSVLRSIRENTKTNQIPVILATALGTEHVVKSATSVGVDDFIVKPFRLEQIANRVELHLLVRTPALAKRLVIGLTDKDKVVRSAVSFKGIDWEYWDLYSSKYLGHELFIIIPKDADPQATSEISDDESRQKIMIYAKIDNSWCRVWPRQRLGEAPDSKVA